VKTLSENPINKNTIEIELIKIISQNNDNSRSPVSIFVLLLNRLLMSQTPSHSAIS